MGGEPSLIFLRSKKDIHSTYCNNLMWRQKEAKFKFWFLIWLFSLGNYTFAPHSLFQKLRLFSFSTLSYQTPRKVWVPFFDKISNFSSDQGGYGSWGKMCDNVINAWFCMGEHFIKGQLTKTWKKSKCFQQDTNLWPSNYLLKFSSAEM